MKISKLSKIEGALIDIRNGHGKRKTDELIVIERNAWSVIRENMEEMTVDIRAAEFTCFIEDRYFVQTVEIPSGKRGNLSKFAGKEVFVIPTTIMRGSPRINFYICEA